MKFKTIHILAMKTWGELGNMLAARVLAKTINRYIPEVQIEIFDAESLFPRFADIGEKIRRLSIESPNASIRGELYLQLMSGLNKIFYPGFEKEKVIQSPIESEMQPVIDHFKKKQPDLVIGTKGVISRLCLAALNRLRSETRVVNFVTNHGLLLLDIHRSKHIPLHLVQFQEAKDFLESQQGFDGHQVKVVGPLAAGHELKHDLIENSPDLMENPIKFHSLKNEISVNPLVIVFCNRGKNEYFELLHFLADNHKNTQLIFIAYNNPELLAEARYLMKRKQLKNWKLFNRLSQKEYFHIIAQMSQSALLISKTGPNTALEAIYFGMPLLLLNSGLPMEKWVHDMVEKWQLGKCFKHMKSLITILDSWLLNPETLAFHRQQIFHFKENQMNQDHTAQRISAEIVNLFNQGSTFVRGTGDQ